MSSDEGRRAAAQDPSEPADPPVSAGAAGSSGAGDNWDPEGIAVAALGEVVAAFGAGALADEDSLANRLSDLIPNDSLLREQRLLVAASKRNVAASIEEHMSQGIGIGGAVRLTAAALYEQEPFDSSGCEWVTSAFARALGYADRADPGHSSSDRRVAADEHAAGVCDTAHLSPCAHDRPLVASGQPDEGPAGGVPRHRPRCHRDHDRGPRELVGQGSVAEVFDVYVFASGTYEVELPSRRTAGVVLAARRRPGEQGRRRTGRSFLQRHWRWHRILCRRRRRRKRPVGGERGLDERG